MGLFDRFKSSKEPQNEPTTAFEWYGKGLDLELEKDGPKKNHSKKAIPCYDKALEIDPQYVQAWESKARALRSLDRHEEAIPCFDKAIQLYTSDIFLTTASYWLI